MCYLAAAFKRYTPAVGLVLMLASYGAAQQPPSELRVAVAVVSPFVMKKNGTLDGFSIELWNAIAARLRVKTTYIVMPDGASLAEAMRSKKADLIATPVVITSARDLEFDFSLPIMQSGLQVMVREGGRTAKTNPLKDLLHLLFSKTTVIWLGIALVLVLIPAHLVWLLERRHKDSMISNRNYFPGIFEALYWAISTLTTQAEFMPHQWAARLLAIFWMFAGVVFVAFYTAQLTTTLTVQQIQGEINGPEDLPGKPVATIENTTAADYLTGQNIQAQAFRRLDDMFAALLNKKVDAVVFGARVLGYYAAHQGKGRVTLVGPEFNADSIAMVFPRDSPLRRRIDVALLQLHENGSYREIYRKWFGGP
jgi:polar amino acid transport system substrate-binding protein